MNNRFFLFLFFCLCSTAFVFTQASLAGTVQEANRTPAIGTVANLVGSDNQLNTGFANIPPAAAHKKS